MVGSGLAGGYSPPFGYFSPTLGVGFNLIFFLAFSPGPGPLGKTGMAG